MNHFVKFIYLFIILSVLNCCNNNKVSYSDFDKNALKTLKEFQMQALKYDSIIERNRQRATTYNYNSVYETNFKKHFPFLEDKLSEELLQLLKNKKILHISYRGPNCINFPIKVLGNSLIYAEWEELFLAYSDNTNKACINTFNGYSVDSSKIRQIDSSWYLIVAKDYRKIRG